MISTWAAFLRKHKDSDEYNRAAMEVTELCNLKEDKNKVFKKMSEAQTLVVVSKSAVDSAA